MHDNEQEYRTYIKEHEANSPTSPALLSIEHNLADHLIKQRNCSEAETILRHILPSIRATYGDHAPQSVSCYRDMIRAVDCLHLDNAEVERIIKKAWRLTNGMKRTGYGKEQRVEKGHLEKLESDRAALAADIDERFEYMKDVVSVEEEMNG